MTSTSTSTTAAAQSRPRPPGPPLQHPASAEVLERVPGKREISPRRFRRRRRIEDLALAAGVPIILLAIWQVAATNGWINAQYFPAPTTIWSAGVSLVADGDLQDDTWVTLTRVALSLFWGVITGVAAGFAMGNWRRLRVALEPTLSAFYTVPKLALLPLFLMIFGPGETPIIITGAATVFFFMWISTMAAVIGIESGYSDAAAAFGASRWGLFRHVLMPAALPQIMVALRISAGISVLVIVGTEFVQSDSGLGNLIWFSWSLFQASRMYVGIVVVALLGFGFALVTKLVARLCIRWTSLDDRPGAM